MATSGAGDNTTRLEDSRQIAAIRKANRVDNDECSGVSWQEKLDAALANSNLKEEIQEAYKVLEGELPRAAAGATCPVRSAQVVREAIKAGQSAPASDAKQKLPCSCGLFPLLKRQGRRSMDARNRTWTGHTHAKAAFCAKPRCC
jgi:hypothetical protein